MKRHGRINKNGQTKPTQWRRLLSLASMLLLGLVYGCSAVGPNYKPPVPDLPDQWHQELVEGVNTGESNFQSWWTLFHDPVLEEIIRRATEESPDLAIAMARITESRARLTVVTGEKFPDLSGNGLSERSRSGDDFGNRTLDTYSLGLGASWEIDFWGRIARSVESARAGYQASVEDYRDALVLLYSEIARNYVEVRKLGSRIRYAEANARIQRETLMVTRNRFAAEIAPALDVHQAELNLATTESAIFTLKDAKNQSINRLSVLSGNYPGALHKELSQVSSIPAPPQRVPVGLPANLLRQRPDIRRAERLLAAQTERIGIATADLYPSFSLSGSFGLHSLSTGDLFESGSRFWSFGPSLHWNIFNGGAVKGRIRVEEALAEQALAAYERTVLRAVEDVENALGAYAMEKGRRSSLEKSVAAARKSVELVDQLYRIGLTDFQNLLDMQRSLFQQQDALAESEGRISQNIILLYKALGGGWRPGSPENLIKGNNP